MFITVLGFRVGFLGHDLHGVHFGRTERFSFSIGDRGSNIKWTMAECRRTGHRLCVRATPDGRSGSFSVRIEQSAGPVFDLGNLFTGEQQSIAAMSDVGYAG